MKEIVKEFEQKTYTSAAFDLYFKGMTLGVLDIETTGLDPSRNSFIVGGLLLVADGKCRSYQCFAENTNEELTVLEAYLKQVKKADFLLTYNGRHFDLPFIKKRSVEFCPPLPYNFDLYLVLNGYSSLRRHLPNLKQKTVENFMGLWKSRTDEISGKESVLLYNEYMATKSKELKEKILLHNHDDIYQLYQLLGILEKCDLHRALHFMGFPALLSTQKQPGLQVEKINLSGNHMTIHGIQQGPALSYRAYEGGSVPCTILFDVPTSTFEIRFPLIRYSGLVLVDLMLTNVNYEDFEQYPTFGDGLLILEDHGKRNYLEINHFVKLLLERIMKQWITKA